MGTQVGNGGWPAGCLRRRELYIASWRATSGGGREGGGKKMRAESALIEYPVSKMDDPRPPHPWEQLEHEVAGRSKKKKAGWRRRPGVRETRPSGVQISESSQWDRQQQWGWLVVAGEGCLTCLTADTPGRQGGWVPLERSRVSMFDDAFNSLFRFRILSPLWKAIF